MFVSKHVVFLEKEFLLRENCGSNDELGEVQSAQRDTNQLTSVKDVIHGDEVTTNPFKTQAHIVGYVLFQGNIDLSLANSGTYCSLKINEPTTYDETLSNSELDTWHETMKSRMDSM